MHTETFGYMPSGEKVSVAAFQTEDLRARVIGYGAALADLQFRHVDGWRRVVLGLKTLEDYRRHSPHFGATAGRYAGRIRDGRVKIGGQIHQLTRNTPDGHHVHGGTCGFGKRNWTLASCTETSATFALISPDGEEGYPGQLNARTTYRLARNCLEVELEATSSAATPVNLLHHSYFNLDGEGTIAGHRLRVDAERRAEVCAAGLPTGAFVPVDGAYDFRKFRCPDPAHAYDTSYLLNGETGTCRPVAELVSSSGDLRMEVWTNEPALHFYDGSKLSVPVSGLDDRPLPSRSGLCLEPTRMSDAPNMPGFPNATLSPGETYRQISRFVFTGS